MNQGQKVIRVKVGVLELAKQLGQRVAVFPSGAVRQNRAIEEESVELIVTSRKRSDGSGSGAAVRRGREDRPRHSASDPTALCSWGI